MITLDQGGAARGIIEITEAPSDLVELVEHVAVVPSERLRAIGDWRVVPDVCPHLIFHRYRDGSSHAVLVGPRSRQVDVSPSVRLYTVAVRLRPGTIPVLTGVPAWDLRDRGMRLADAFGADGAEVENRLAEVTRPAEAGKILLSTVRARASEAVDWRVRGFERALAGSRSHRISDIAGRLGIGERTLRETIRSSVGLRPKEATRITRLHYALTLAFSGHGGARAALGAGYADQAHYVRDSRRLLGETPGAFRARAAVSYKTSGGPRPTDEARERRHGHNGS